jgi:hypothetical protein
VRNNVISLKPYFYRLSIFKNRWCPPIYEGHYASYMKNTIQLWKKIMEEVIIKPVGSQHILFSLQSFVVITCEGFVLILKFVMRIYWGARGDLFLLDTTTFSLVVFALFKSDLLLCLRSVCMLMFLHPTVVLQGQILTMSWIFINHYKSAVFGVRVPYQMLLHEYYLSRFMLSDL